MGRKLSEKNFKAIKTAWENFTTIIGRDEI